MVIALLSSAMADRQDSEGLLGALIGSSLISMQSTSSGTRLFLPFRRIVEVVDADDDDGNSSLSDAWFIEIAGKHSASMSAKPTRHHASISQSIFCQRNKHALSVKYVIIRRLLTAGFKIPSICHFREVKQGKKRLSVAIINRILH